MPRNGKIEVEKGIPIPINPHLNKYRQFEYPFEQMEIGDSFFIAFKPESEYDTTKKLRDRVANQARRYNKNVDSNFRFIVHQVPKGARCWRVEDQSKKEEK